MHVSRETVLAALPPGLDASGLDAYASLLETEGVRRGLIGPREVPRLWERHIGNSAWVVVPAPGLVPDGSSVADVGSGAGLPGIVWALVRPDLRVTLIEPLLRRATFLGDAVADLGLSGRVTVVRDRAENLRGSTWDVVTARAVAPLQRLAGWTFPLVSETGVLLALKGEGAESEIAAADADLRRLGAGQPTVVTCGLPGAYPTRVVVVPRRSVRRG